MKPFTSKHCVQYLTKSSPFRQEEELTNQQKRKAKKVAKKVVKSMDKLSQAREIEGRHGFAEPLGSGANKKSERKQAAHDRKKEKAKKAYEKMSASEKAYVKIEGKKMRQKK